MQRESTVHFSGGKTWGTGGWTGTCFNCPVFKLYLFFVKYLENKTYLQDEPKSSCSQFFSRTQG